MEKRDFFDSNCHNILSPVKTGKEVMSHVPDHLHDENLYLMEP